MRNKQSSDPINNTAKDNSPFIHIIHSEDANVIEIDDSHDDDDIDLHSIGRQSRQQFQSKRCRSTSPTTVSYLNDNTAKLSIIQSAFSLEEVVDEVRDMILQSSISLDSIVTARLFDSEDSSLIGSPSSYASTFIRFSTSFDEFSSTTANQTTTVDNSEVDLTDPTHTLDSPKSASNRKQKLRKNSIHNRLCSKLNRSSKHRTVVHNGPSSRQNKVMLDPQISPIQSSSTPSSTCSSETGRQKHDIRSKSKMPPFRRKQQRRSILYKLVNVSSSNVSSAASPSKSAATTVLPLPIEGPVCNSTPNFPISSSVEQRSRCDLVEEPTFEWDDIPEKLISAGQTVTDSIADTEHEGGWDVFTDRSGVSHKCILPHDALEFGVVVGGGAGQHKRRRDVESIAVGRRQRKRDSNDNYYVHQELSVMEFESQQVLLQSSMISQESGYQDESSTCVVDP